MLNPSPMLRVRALVLDRDVRAVLRALGRIGVFHLRSEPAGADAAPLPTRDRGEALAGTCDILTRIRDLRQVLELPEPTARRKSPPAAAAATDAAFVSIEKRVRELVQERRRLQTRRDELSASILRLSRFRDVDLPVGKPYPFEFLHFVAGSLPTANLPRFHERIGPDTALLTFPPEGGRQFLIAFVPRAGRAVLDQALDGTDFRPEPFADTGAATSRESVLAAEAERIRSDETLARVESALADAAASAGPLLARLEADVRAEARLLQAEQCFTRTESAVLMAGWAPARRQSEMEAAVSAATDGRHVIEVASPEAVPDEEPPVLLRPPRLFRPFTLLVQAFGLPGYREVDPTVFLAVSYLIMFGMMFGDVGHGLILALGGLVAWRAGRSETVRNAGPLLIYGGLSGMVFGVIYGSYFGIERMKAHALWHDPLRGEAADLMRLAVGFSVVLISTGAILNVVNRFRRGDVTGGWLDRFGIAGIVFYWGSLALLAKFAALQARGLVPLAMALFVALPVLAWVVRGPVEQAVRRRRRRAPGGESEGMGSGLTESVIGAFEAAFAYVANTVSFVRLAAYAMSHAALLFAAFTLAGEVERNAGGPTALSIAIVVAGNVLAIALEGVIATLQALRLEFYEFFGKFFTGAGRPFQPFRL